MRKLLITALALALGLGVAYAQNITRSVQGSQDPRGPIGWDTSNSMYFPGHINAFGNETTAPTCSCGRAGGSIGSGSTDAAGTLTIGGTSSAYITFGSPYNAAPMCIVQGNTANTSGSSASVTTGTTSWNLTNVLSGSVYSYICIGNQ